MKDVLKIYAKKGNYGWFAPLDNSKQGDERVVYFMELAFKQGNEPTVSPCRLDIGHCFLSCYPAKNGIKPKLVITEYEVEKTFEGSATVAPMAPANGAPQPTPNGGNVYHAPAASDSVMPYDPYAQGGAGVSYPTAGVTVADEDIPF